MNAPRKPFVRAAVAAAGAALALLTPASIRAEENSILNASYDVARKFYEEYNAVFAPYWKEKSGVEPEISQSHGGSSKQARSVVDGLEADVVTFNQETDIEILVESGLVRKDWKTAFPHNASPNNSTILFLVREGNPKNIKDWNDLIRDDVEPILPNPKTSGNGRYSYLAAWAYAQSLEGGTPDSAKAFVKKLLSRVPVLDTGGRGATTTFVQNGIGDVLLTFESEVHLAIQDLGEDKFDAVVPTLSIRADNPVAVVDSVVDKRGSRKLAEAYLGQLFSAAGQQVAVDNFLRPVDEALLKANADRFPAIKLIDVDEFFGGWKKVIETHFAEGAVFDQIYDKK